jgi:hypothetical protein
MSVKSGQGQVEDEVDLVLAVAPVIEAAPRVDCERPECRGDEVLDERSLFLGIVEGRESPLQGSVPDSSVDEVERPSSFLHRCLPPGVVGSVKTRNACSR